MGVRILVRQKWNCGLQWQLSRTFDGEVNGRGAALLGLGEGFIGLKLVWLLSNPTIVKAL
jgi:hypothetical protein